MLIFSENTFFLFFFFCRLEVLSECSGNVPVVVLEAVILVVKGWHKWWQELEYTHIDEASIRGEARLAEIARSDFSYISQDAVKMMNPTHCGNRCKREALANRQDEAVHLDRRRTPEFGD